MSLFLPPICFFSASFYLPSSSPSPSCRLGTEPPPSLPPTCGRTCSRLGRRAPRALETPLWKVRGRFIWGGADFWGIIMCLSLIFKPICYFSLTDPTLCGIERQRPGSLSSTLGGQSHGPSFPALPRPSGVPSAHSLNRNTEPLPVGVEEIS